VHRHEPIQLLEVLHRAHADAMDACTARLNRARQDGELPADTDTDTDTDTLAAHFGIVIQGLAVEARKGVKPALLKRLADLAMQAWPQSPASG
jgi:hypothetical protein